MLDGVVDEGAGDELEVLDSSAPAPPSLDHPLLASLVTSTGEPPRAKLGWTDVAFFAHTFDFSAWLERTGCEGEEAERATELLGARVQDGRLTLDKIGIKAMTGF